GLSKQLWESARFLADFHSCGSFHRPFFFLVLFLLRSSLRGRPAGSRYEPSTPLPQRLKETFERDRRRERNVCSDVVLRGLDYKDYVYSLLDWFLANGV